ncbi:hypothetical protein [Lentibacillus sp. Marseille-P4043]|uniref:hypothetical protein n=1 Tax=Lentibacillus sp. Marseille-P4043 TaxID=2040293 RepID=UPI000D0B8057|nr:hypothetical protein [Lentibacillus sp. Marseille-P4043]
MQIISLSSLIHADKTDGREVQKYLSSFACKQNTDVQSYLHNKAANSEKRGFSRTTLIIDDENNNDIIGYFTLLIKNFDFTDVSGTIKSKLTGNKKATSFTTILIAQLGRADSYKGKVTGGQILEIALERCSLINELSAVRVACVEYEDIEPLHKFYSENEFKIIQKNDNGYLISYVRL